MLDGRYLVDLQCSRQFSAQSIISGNPKLAQGTIDHIYGLESTCLGFLELLLRYYIPPAPNG
jgi:hypothetical protein